MFVFTPTCKYCTTPRLLPNPIFSLTVPYSIIELLSLQRYPNKAARDPFFRSSLDILRLQLCCCQAELPSRQRKFQA